MRGFVEITRTRSYNATQCNCRKPDDCPLNGQCLRREIVYQATVETDDGALPMIYIGASGTSFKQRLANHKAPFSHMAKENSTELSKHVWQLKTFLQMQLPFRKVVTITLHVGLL